MAAMASLRCGKLRSTSVYRRQGQSSNLKCMTFREAVLSRTLLFRLFGKITARPNRDVIVEDYINPAKGDMVLDVGCGYGELSSRLDRTIYTGIDISPKYIKYANQRYENLGRFICGDITKDSEMEHLGQFDIVTSMGVLHHLSDDDCQTLLLSVKRRLTSTGRLITLDGVFTQHQSPIARLLLRLDRGKYVRTEEHYRRLLSGQFEISKSDIRTDLIAIPFTHFATVCHPK